MTMLTVGDRFPEFACEACDGLQKDDIRTITNADDHDQWKVFFFYPKDFTFVCPTEIAEFGRKYQEFRDRDCVVYGGSTDNEFCHMAWRRSHDDLRDLPYPLIAAQKLCRDLGILDEKEQVAMRATFIVDPHGVIQWAQCNNMSVGRNVQEVLRVIDAVQSDELCPCNWQKGDPYLELAAAE